MSWCGAKPEGEARVTYWHSFELLDRVAAKIFRALYGAALAARGENGLLQDSLVSAKVALIGIDRSIEALATIAVEDDDHASSCCRRNFAACVVKWMPGFLSRERWSAQGSTARQRRLRKYRPRRRCRPMARLRELSLVEALLRRHTWFTEGTTSPTFRNSGTLGEGWLQRYGIDAAVHEFNCNWIAGLKQSSSSTHWRAYGAGLARVFHDYFEQVNP